MKLVIQIPCLNEADTLPRTLADLPSRIPGFDEIEVIVIDDGSADGTRRVAERLGVAQVRRFARTRGLARAFSAGLDVALSRGADVIVNTDGDHQYAGADIARLVRPIAAGDADLVIGARDIQAISGFSRRKKLLQRVGSAAIRRLSGCPITDAPSGFRAFSREAAEQIVILSGFSHTLETLLQVNRLGLSVREVPIRANERSRPSRLATNTVDYLFRSALALAPAMAAHQPRVCLIGALVGALLLAAGLGAALTPAGGVAILSGLLVAVASVLWMTSRADWMRQARRRDAFRASIVEHPAVAAREELAEPWAMVGGAPRGARREP
ncbi:MAG: hypothetical protein DHS20C21_18720 [Gemmatimonadota bacterium]|nr:MAG: hypothetical protein DHS20C21_18720 [Gemmatimonadota bacterium]